MSYGISALDLRIQSEKNEKQREFMATSTFVTSSGAVKNLLDVSMSANISTRYYAQLVNKVNTLQQVMTNENLTPIFLTITLDGWLQRLLVGDYSKFDEEKHIRKLPENDKYGYLKTKALTRLCFDVHDLYMVLRWQWERFLSERTARKIRDVSKIGYVFAVEPHESGAPHSHVLMYIPSEFCLDLLKDFKRIFDAPRNLAQTKKKRANAKNGLTAFQIKNGEINGFQWTLSNPVGYVLKYATKSFMDLKNQNEIDELQAWYMKYRITRISTSHTLVPQWVYNKIYPLENNWLYLSEIKKNGTCEWSQEDDYFKFDDIRLSKTFIYQKGVYQYYANGVLEREFGTPKVEKELNTMAQHQRVITSTVPRPLRWSVSFEGTFKFTQKGKFHIYIRDLIKNRIDRNFYDVSLNKITFSHFIPAYDLRSTCKPISNNDDNLNYYFVSNGKEYDMRVKSIQKRTDLDLFAHFSALNPLNPDYKFFPLVDDNFKYYNLVRNECIDRGLLKASKTSCNNFFTHDNPFEAEFNKARAYFSSMSAINTFVSIKNTISKMGA